MATNEPITANTDHVQNSRKGGMDTNVFTVFSHHKREVLVIGRANTEELIDNVQEVTHDVTADTIVITFCCHNVKKFIIVIRMDKENNGDTNDVNNEDSSRHLTFYYNK